MRRTTLAAAVCICLIAIAAATMAQTPGYGPVPTTAPAPYAIPAPPSYVGQPQPANPPSPYAPAGDSAPTGYYAPAYRAPVATYPAAGYPATTIPTGPIANSVDGLMSKWKSATESDRPEVEKDLREALKKEMQANLVQDENAIKGLEAQVKQLQERLDLRRQKQDEIIDLHLQQLLHDAQGLGWVQTENPLFSFSLGMAR